MIAALVILCFLLWIVAWYRQITIRNLERYCGELQRKNKEQSECIAAWRDWADRCNKTLSDCASEIEQQQAVIETYKTINNA